MLVRMTKVQVVGLRWHLDDVLDVLHDLSAVHVVNASSEMHALPALPVDGRAGREAELRAQLQELDRLLEAGPTATGDISTVVPAAPLSEVDLRAHLDVLTPRLAALDQQRDVLAAEAITAPRSLAALMALLPLLPELAELSDDDLRRLGLATVVAVLDSRDGVLVAALEEDLRDRVGDRVSVTSNRLDESTVAVAVVYPHDVAAEVHEVLGRDRVTHQALPDTYATHGLPTAVAALRTRLTDLTAEQAAVDAAVAGLLAPHLPALRATQDAVAAELTKVAVTSRLGSTARTFIVIGWIPSAQVPELRTLVDQRFAGEIVVEEVATSATDPAAPVLLRNRGQARPYEALVSFLALPRSGSLDPTTLMALALPVLFGVMVGDLGYGVLLLGIAYGIRRRYGGATAIARDVAQILTACASASIVFGLLFGEFFGSLGNKLGMPALWFYRGGPDALQPLLLLALGIGAAHVVLGLVLGVAQSLRDRHHRHALERIGTLLVLAGLFGLGAATVVELPAELMSVKVAAVVVGLVLVTSLGGLVGVITGPLELLSVFGNILSYLRLAAVGLASVYLANVANELAAAAPLPLGIAVAVFFHTLNLALAAFSPLIQALRLHYVEMFSKFFEPGGQPYTPFGRGGGAGSSAPAGIASTH